MQVKLIQNGVSTDWFELTKNHHVSLLHSAQQPDFVVVHIGDLFPGSPESSQTVKLDFEMFTVLAREFVLKESRLKKQDTRHIAKIPLSEIDKLHQSSLISSVESDYERSELRQKVERAQNLLTVIQKRRFLMHFEEGLTYRRIAELEGGLHHKVIEESVAEALKKFKKYFG